MVMIRLRARARVGMRVRVSVRQVDSRVLGYHAPVRLGGGRSDGERVALVAFVVVFAHNGGSTYAHSGGSPVCRVWFEACVEFLGFEVFLFRDSVWVRVRVWVRAWGVSLRGFVSVVVDCRLWYGFVIDVTSI